MMKMYFTNYNQCNDTDPAELVEAIENSVKQLDNGEHTPTLRNAHKNKGSIRSSIVSQNNGEGTLRNSQNGSVLGSFSGTDSVRSATIRRGGNGGRPRSSIQIFEQGPLPGVPSPEVIPIAMPTPPPPRANPSTANGNVLVKQNKVKGLNEGVSYKPPLVASLSTKLSSGPGSLEPNHRFQYNATDDYAKKGKYKSTMKD